jgi:tripartite-type tricarboxylate transporter receptor subunit TctC
VTDLPYDPLHDFIAVAPLTSQAYVLVAGKTRGVRSLGELITAGKARPGELTFASAGVGTATHVGVEQFNREAGITAVHVPASPADAIGDTIANTAAGTTDYAMSPIAIAAPHIQRGELIALGVTSARRSALLPEVPTISEAGVAGFDFPIWYGLWAPAGTSDAVVHKLADDVARALALPDLRNWLAAHGAHPMRMTQAKFASFVLAESERAARIVKDAGSMLE